jgi:biopolymer transport protein ExbB
LLSIIQAAGWPIWPLIACSVLALSIIIERFVNLRAARVAPPDLFNSIITRARAKALTNEEIAAWETGSLLGMVLSSPLRFLQEHPRCSEQELKEAMQNAGQEAAMRLDQFLSALGTIASVAPLLGLLGTVVGMIEIFGAQGTAGAIANPTQLAQGISMALYNTAFGLAVAIPALICWRYFRNRVDAYVLSWEIQGAQLLGQLKSLRR